jgi:hypothetical protein
LGTLSYPVRQPNWEDLPIGTGYPKPSLGSHYPKCSLNKTGGYPRRRIYNRGSGSLVTLHKISDTESNHIPVKGVAVSRSAGWFGCYVSCPNAVSSRVIHLVFHRHQHNCFSSLDSIKLVYQHPLERSSAATDSCDSAQLLL